MGNFLFGSLGNSLYLCGRNQQNSNIMAKFFLRTSKTDGESYLYILVNRPKHGIRWKVNSGIKVSVSAWTKAQTSAKALDKYYSTEEGRAVREKADMCEKVIKDYFDNIQNASEADIKELCLFIKEIVNTDINEKREELNEIKKDKIKIEADQEARHLNEVLIYYETFLDGIQKGSVRHGDEKRYTDSTISAWRTFGNHLRGFLKAKKTESLHFDDITKRTATAFVTYLESEGLMKGTIGQLVNHFRKLCNAAAEDGQNTNAVSLKVWKSHDQKDKDKRAEIALTDSEIDAIYDMELTGHIERCRDIWMLGYFSAQRVSDYSTFTKDNFAVNPDGTPIILVHQKKTDTELEIPILDERVYEICRKYDYKFPALKRDAINRGIKEACKILSESLPSLKVWETTLLAANERAKELWYIEARKRVAAGEKLHGEESKRFKRCVEYAAEHESGEYLYKRNYKGDVIRQRWELVSCHTTRRSMITNLHRTGLFDDREIMSVSGHQTIKSYEKYMKVTKTERATSIYEKMKKAKEVEMKKEA